MKTFVFLLKEKQRGQLTQSLLEAHVAHLQALKKSGQLVICGPFADDEGALQILRADSKPSAIEVFSQDPFIQQNYYRQFDCYELNEANESNNWLMGADQTRGNLKS